MNMMVSNLCRLFSSQTTPSSSSSFEVEESSIRVNKFHAGICINPHPAKAAKGGEDAASLSDNVIAVADGVGGWAESGVDPADYSRSLCKHIDTLVQSDTTGVKYGSDPR